MTFYLKKWNRYGCVPNERCNCPPSFRLCSAWTTLREKAAEGDPDAIFDLATAETVKEQRSQR